VTVANDAGLDPTVSQDDYGGLYGYKTSAHGACKALSGPLPKHAHKCTRGVYKGSFSHQDKAGSNSFNFNGRVGGHRLSLGSYQVQATAKLGALTGKTVKAGFKIG
jgi:hypothetical protein